jgi:hypothetical protein
MVCARNPKDTKKMPIPGSRAEHASRNDLTPNAVRDVAVALGALPADIFALYLKTKNFHWHMSGSHFCDYHLMLDEQSGQIFAVTDDIAERVEDRRDDDPIDRSNRTRATHPRQRRGLCGSAGHTGGVARRRPEVDQKRGGFTSCAINTVMSRRPACSKIGSTRQNAGSGSCMKPVGGLAFARARMRRA